MIILLAKEYERYNDIEIKYAIMLLKNLEACKVTKEILEILEKWNLLYILTNIKVLLYFSSFSRECF